MSATLPALAAVAALAALATPAAGGLHLASAAPASSEAGAEGGGHGYFDLGPWLNETLAPLFRTTGDQLGINGVAVVLLLAAGAFFMMIAAIGVVRLPDLYTRMHAASKAGTLGVTCLILAVAVRFIGTPAGLGAAVEALLVLVFIFLTTPVAAHLIGRAAYRIDVPMSDNTIIDELGQHARSHAVNGSEDPDPANNAFTLAGLESNNQHDNQRNNKHDSGGEQKQAARERATG